MTKKCACVYLYFLKWQVWTDNMLLLRDWQVWLTNRRKKKSIAFRLINTVFIPIAWSWMLQERICNHFQRGHYTFIKSETAPLQSTKTRDLLNTWNYNFQISFFSLIGVCSADRWMHPQLNLNRTTAIISDSTWMKKHVAWLSMWLCLGMSLRQTWLPLFLIKSGNNCFIGSKLHFYLTNLI